MTPSMRSDSVSEHVQHLCVSKLEDLPNTLIGQYIRAVAAIYNGRARLKELQAKHKDMNLSDAALAASYNLIVCGEIIQNSVRADLRYHRLHLENTFLSGQLQSSEDTADQQTLQKRQSKLHKLIRESEKSSSFDPKWKTDNVAQLQYEARGMLIDDLATELKSAVTNELYMQHLLYDHGHSKLIFIQVSLS